MAAEIAVAVTIFAFFSFLVWVAYMFAKWRDR